MTDQERIEKLEKELSELRDSLKIHMSYDESYAPVRYDPITGLGDTTISSRDVGVVEFLWMLRTHLKCRLLSIPQVCGMSREKMTSVCRDGGELNASETRECEGWKERRNLETANRTGGVKDCIQAREVT